jgi:ribosomal protein L24
VAARIKKGDMVFVNCGKDIGKTGEVLKNVRNICNR